MLEVPSHDADKVLDEDATETEKANFEKAIKLHRIQMETDSKNAKNNLLTEYDNIEVPDTEIPKDEKTVSEFQNGQKPLPTNILILILLAKFGCTTKLKFHIGKKTAQSEKFRIIIQTFQV